jgi:hypothetical protein
MKVVLRPRHLAFSLITYVILADLCPQPTYLNHYISSFHSHSLSFDSLYHPFSLICAFRQLSRLLVHTLRLFIRKSRLTATISRLLV